MTLYKKLMKIFNSFLTQIVNPWVDCFTHKPNISVKEKLDDIKFDIDQRLQNIGLDISFSDNRKFISTVVHETHSSYHKQIPCTMSKVLDHVYHVELINESNTTYGFKFCSIDRWAEPDCNPAYIYKVAFDDVVTITSDNDNTTHSYTSRVFAILTDLKEYWIVPPGNDLFTTELKHGSEESKIGKIMQIPNELLLKQIKDRLKKLDINNPISRTEVDDPWINKK